MIFLVSSCVTVHLHQTLPRVPAKVCARPFLAFLRRCVPDPSSCVCEGCARPFLTCVQRVYQTLHCVCVKGVPPPTCAKGVPGTSSDVCKGCAGPFHVCVRRVCHLAFVRIKGVPHPSLCVCERCGLEITSEYTCGTIDILIYGIGLQDVCYSLVPMPPPSLSSLASDGKLGGSCE